MTGSGSSVRPIRDDRGRLVLNWRYLLGAAGYGPKEGDWEIEGDLVFPVDGQRRPDELPYSAKEVRKEAGRMIQEAKRWLRQTFPGLMRALKLDEYRTVQLYRQGRRADIQRVGVGERVQVKHQGGSYFGSGGAWGQFVVYGEIDKVGLEREDWDNGFIRGGVYEVTFSKGPAAVYSAAGDGINGGRVFFRRLIVAQ